jgi:integrase
VRREAQLWDRAVLGDRGAHGFGEAAVAYLQARKPGPSATVKLRPVVEHFQHWPIDKINQAALDAYIAARHPRSAPATIIRVVMTPVVAVLRHAAKRGWCDVPAFERPKVPTPAPRWLTRDEADRLIDACSPHMKPLVSFLLHTGGRLGEALRLQWAQVDLGGDG